MPRTCLQKRFYGLWLAMVAASALAATAGAQQLPPPRPVEAPLPDLPADLVKKPKSAKELAGFMESLSRNDAAFEVTIGQGRILTTAVDLGAAGKPALVAAGDPFVADFAIINNRQIRVTGQRIGVTDLSITTGDGKTYSFEVRVTMDLSLLHAQLRRAFPDASIRLSQVRDYIVIEGQVRDVFQQQLVLKAVVGFMQSVEFSETRKSLRQQPNAGTALQPKGVGGEPAPAQPALAAQQTQGQGQVQQGQPKAEDRIINLLRIPGPQQVLLKVRVAELNRTAFRQIGADMLFANPNGSGIIGTTVGNTNNTVNTGVEGGRKFFSTLLNTAAQTTAFGLFDDHFDILISALRRNELLKILAEPNLVAMNGHRADFLAGGEFPVPIPQTSTGGAGTSVTVTFKEFGVKLGFVPHILDGGAIRLSVDPEVSSIDFSIGAIIVPGGSPVPGLNTRKAHTTVEIREGQTLAIAGLLQVTLDGRTNRIPGLGDVPVLGPFFSNTTSNRIEKELIVLVTPYLVDSQPSERVPPVPGFDVNAPNDLEFYLGNRIESRTGRDWRATTRHYASPPALLPAYLRLHQEYIRGPHGFGE